MSRLQSVLRAAARLVLGLPGRAPISAATQGGGVPALPNFGVFLYIYAYTCVELPNFTW